MNPMKRIQFAAIVILSSLATAANADRPSMSERSAPAPQAEPVMSEPAPVMQQAPVEVMTETVQSGDVMQIQPGETVPVQVLPFPRRGMDMSRVQNELGEPLTISPTVGQPPITTWSYPDRKVYFEGRTVIHAVAIN